MSVHHHIYPTSIGLISGVSRVIVRSRIATVIFIDGSSHCVPTELILPIIDDAFEVFTLANQYPLSSRED